MKNFKTFSSALAMLICFLTYGQERIITGVVSDGHEALPFATIFAKAKKQGIQTNIDGKFSIKAKPGDKLIFSYVGFDNFELEIGEEISNYYIALKSNAIELQETYEGPIPKIRHKDSCTATKKIVKSDLKKITSK